MNMKGAKRFGVSDSNLDASNSVFQNKRLMVGSQFSFPRAEPSQQQPTETPQLDVRRGESSRQHVRALNTQFASWIQTQLQNHPDELWEDGVRDYLTHASNILEKFSDVVNWLKANAAKTESSSAPELQTAPNKPIIESKDNGIKVFPEKIWNTSVQTSAAFTSVSSGALFNSQTPFSFGLRSSTPLQQGLRSSTPLQQAATISGLQSSLPFQQATTISGLQSSTPVQQNAMNDDAEEVEQPSSPSVKKTEEKGVNVVHEVKCKLYVKSSDPVDKDAWRDKGTGQLSIRCKEGFGKGTKESKPNILVRNDVGKLLLNALLYPGIKTTMQKNCIVAIFHTSGDGAAEGGNNDTVVAQTFLIRTKSEEDRNKLAAAIQEYAPAA
ncbi:hypothetical protein RJ640_018812 [Escallonia rubra]|uniref:RanBD1 domain-containing protein n=1 Tax=Escallonia rubra TaxID=112253 RepID=A0AA88UQX9_9ASTE|nr:hypothetical protein RJ640_018812 [Escallonia rubra]